MTSAASLRATRRKPAAHDEVQTTLVPKKPKPTGLVYDPRMTLHKHEWFSNEQESPARIQRAFKRCQEEGLVMRCTMVPARQISEQALTSIHGRKYIQRIKQSRNFALPELYKLSGQFDGVFFNEATWASSCLAAGSLKHLANLVVHGRLANGFALLRPPGHHAMHSEACGYCFFNNVAITAASFLDPLPTVLQVEEKGYPNVRRTRSRSKSTRDMTRDTAINDTPNLSNADTASKLGSRVKLERILIVDWDVHHGQGTQYAFYQDKRVLFISMHRFEQGNFWPNLREANYDFIGDGPGRGYNVNIPLEETGLTDSDYLAMFHQLIMPIAIEFNPELVIVSCGFDAAIGCPEGRMWLSPAVFGHFIHHLKMLAGGKLVVALEGGYYVDSLAESSVHVLKTLLGDQPAPLRLSCPPCKSTRRTIDACSTALRAHWKSLWVCGPTKIVPRPDLSHFPLMSWPIVKRVVWPDANPLLPDQVKQHVHHIMNEYISVPLPSPSCHLVLLLVCKDVFSTKPTREWTGASNSSTQGMQHVTPSTAWSEQLIQKLGSRFHIHFFRSDRSCSATSKSFGKRVAVEHTRNTCSKRIKISADLSRDVVTRRNCCPSKLVWKASSSYIIPPGVFPSPMVESFYGRTTCGCSFETCGKPWSKASLSNTPNLKAALQKLLVDLFRRKFSRVFAVGQQPDPFQIIEAITDMSPQVLEEYRTSVFRTRNGRTSMGKFNMIGTNNLKNQTEDNPNDFQVTNGARKTLKGHNASNTYENLPTADWKESGSSNYSNMRQSATEMSKLCRLLVVDLSGMKEPFEGKPSEKIFDSSGQLQCDLFWCSVFRGNYAEQLAACSALRRTIQPAHMSVRSNRRIRQVQWLRIPVVDSKASTNNSSYKTVKKDSSGANLIAALLHILLPAAYEYAPDVICLRLEKEWIETNNDNTDNTLGHFLHLLNGIGSPVIVCYCRNHPPSSALLHGVLGRPLHLNLKANDSMTPTSSMQSLIHHILQANGSRWKNLKFPGSPVTWQG
ncbi:hypothetical protein CRM22_004299 [Opisthorchis felineus]|uniref:Histone deacetylase domain-containing protein n=1 Tax=Opisthorchis felineus TaxID=147828 RepID=A0A4S2M207_OPIFE|nr:hypothetical protein CRM22_004299 [Opisthorchis felineus]